MNKLDSKDNNIGTVITFWLVIVKLYFHSPLHIRLPGGCETSHKKYSDFCVSDTFQ